VDEIVFIGTRDTWERWRPWFLEKGYDLYLLEALRIEPREDLDDILGSVDVWRIASTIFTSKTSVKILAGSAKGSEAMEMMRTAGAIFIAVGEGTSEALLWRGYRSLKPHVENVEEAVITAERILRRGARAIVFSSNRLEIVTRPQGISLEQIPIYRLDQDPRAVKELRRLIERGMRRIVVASRTASEIIARAEIESLAEGRKIEIHTMSPRIAEPLMRRRGTRVEVKIYSSRTAKEFIEQLLETLKNPAS
jgi:uroporphyrinogen-III synthase